MTKIELRVIIKDSVEEVWIGRRSMNPIIEQTDLLTEKLWPVIRTELINYDKYCGSHGMSPNFLSPEQNVDEYLKSKQ